MNFLSVPVVLLNSSNLSPYFSSGYKFERNLLTYLVNFIFSSFLYLIKSHFLMTKCLILYVLCKLTLGLKGLIITHYTRAISLDLINHGKDF